MADNPLAGLTLADVARLHSESRVTTIVAGTVTPLLIGTIFTMARLYTRGSVTKNLGVDDALILAAWILSIGVATTNLLLIRYGTGYHEIFMSPSDKEHTAQVEFANMILYMFTITAIKNSISVMYLRIFSDRTSRIWIYVIICLVTAGGIALLLTVFFQCNPIIGIWSSSHVGVKCFSENDGAIFTAAINIAGDLAIVGFILPRIWPLKMPIKQKIILLCIVSLGVLVVAVTIVRLIEGLKLGLSNDIAWDIYSVNIWTAVEVNVGLFCASIPTIRPLMRQLIPRTIKLHSYFIDDTTQADSYGGGFMESRTREQDRESHSYTDQSADYL